MKYGFFICLMLMLCSCVSRKKLELCREWAEELTHQRLNVQDQLDSLSLQIAFIDLHIAMLEDQNAELKALNKELQIKNSHSDTMTFTSEKKDPEMISVNLTVTSDLQYFLEQTEYSYEELQVKILTLKKEYEAKNRLFRVLVRLDRDNKVEDMVRIMTFGSENGIKMVLATDKQMK